MADKPIKHLEGMRPHTPRKVMMIIFMVSAVVLAGIVWFCFTLNPLPPRTVTMATGPEGSSYAYFGKRYQQLLAKNGIKLILVTTDGGGDNLALLRNPKSGVQIGFVEGGIASESDSPELVSLGTLCYEPMRFFSRKIANDRAFFSLRGKRVSVGPEGSDSRALVNELSKRNPYDFGSFRALSLSPEESVDELLKGKIDAAVIMSSIASPLVRRLITAKGIDLANFARADAYVALFPSLYKLVIPEGVGDLEKNRPPRDTSLLATKTSLIVRGSLHPAIQYLLMEAASQIHSRAGVYQKAGEFPAPEALEIALSDNARHYFKSGQPFLQRYMPFWLATMLEQAVILLIPVIGLLYPLIKGLMSLYGWAVQRKIFLVYGELHWLEMEINKLGDQRPSEEILNRIKSLENRTNRLRVSSKYIPMLYSLKDTITNVRARMEKR